MYQALAADYPLTQVGQVMFDTDYTRITKPGAILAVRLPGIYADVANTKDAIVNTNYADDQLTQVFIYKDMKVILIDGKVSDVQ